MGGIVPASKPDATLEQVLAFATPFGLPVGTPFLVGRRGYFGDSLGVAGANDLNLYDDALFLVDGAHLEAWNANVDPSRTRPGMAHLKPGKYLYRLGIHNLSKDPAEHPHYEALVQAGPVTVVRDGTPPVEDTGFFGINIHRGGWNVTSSEGCQTLYPAQYDEWLAAVKGAMADHKVTTIPYVLTSRY